MNQFLSIFSAAALASNFALHLLSYWKPGIIGHMESNFVLAWGVFVILILVFSIRKDFGHFPANLAFLSRVLPKRWHMFLVLAVVYAALTMAWHFVYWDGGSVKIDDGRIILHSHGTFIRNLSQSELDVYDAFVFRNMSAPLMLGLLFSFFWWRRNRVL